ncbi:uncharacterized protein LOC131346653 [Hemibagrus wyckioides]|uniref:uncharacterized protein LOC131346653 n=1 Tax=Hemibagrus wyckioides TaxID=337641 RepID=UPI00266BE5C4|nr:uncharacterized protein LOC131346653 [Hemibagrus wyckioides]
MADPTARLCESLTRRHGVRVVCPMKLSVKNCLGTGELSPPLRESLLAILSVLNVEKLVILLGPALRGRVTPVFLSDRGRTQLSRLGSFPLRLQFGRLLRAPELLLHQTRKRVSPKPSLQPRSPLELQQPRKSHARPNRPRKSHAQLNQTGRSRAPLRRAQWVLEQCWSCLRWQRQARRCRANARKHRTLHQCRGTGETWIWWMSVDKVLNKRKKQGKGRGKKQAKKDTKMGERESDSDDCMSDSVLMFDSQEEQVNVVYSADDIKEFLRNTKWQKNVALEEFFPDRKQFIHDVKFFRREGAFIDVEIFHLKKLITRVNKENSDDD